MSGTLSGIERSENGMDIAVADYRGLRVVIPIDEIVNVDDMKKRRNEDLLLRKKRIVGSILGAEIDFIVKGIDNKTKSAVASRKEAMLRKRQTFYFDEDITTGRPKIYEGRIVEARVISVSEKVVRTEIFGAECSIVSRDLSWEWFGDAREGYNIGDRIIVKITGIKGDTPETLMVTADIKSLTEDNSAENLKKCVVEGNYAGKIIDIYKGIVFIKLKVGVNAVAHSCYDTRMPGKKDEVNFIVTKLDEERNAALGIIAKIVRGINRIINLT
jgi:ribosomal protein S1